MNFVEQLEIKAIGIFALTKSHIYPVYPADAINAIVKLCVRETANKIKEKGRTSLHTITYEDICDDLIQQAEGK